MNWFISFFKLDAFFVEQMLFLLLLCLDCKFIVSLCAGWRPLAQQFNDWNAEHVASSNGVMLCWWGEGSQGTTRFKFHDMQIHSGHRVCSWWYDEQHCSSVKVHFFTHFSCGPQTLSSVLCIYAVLSAIFEPFASSSGQCPVLLPDMQPPAVPSKFLFLCLLLYKLVAHC